MATKKPSRVSPSQVRADEAAREDRRDRALGYAIQAASLTPIKNGIGQRLVALFALCEQLLAGGQTDLVTEMCRTPALADDQSRHMQ